jgi:hypothetical protein
MDLISFEDLVVQPYNSYFSLEKELHEVKSQLSLMEQRLKYLEDKLGYGPKGNLNLEEKIEVLDIKYEELDDEIVMVEQSVQKDIKSIDNRLKKLEQDKGKDNDSATEGSDSAKEDVEEIECMSSKNIDTQSLPSVSINSNGDVMSNKKYYGSLKEKMIDITLKYKDIDKLQLQLFNDIDLYKLLRIFKNTKILRLFIYSYFKLQSLINLIMLHSIKVSYLEISNYLSEHELINLQKYCDFYKIELKVI